MVLLERIELSASPLPRVCSTTELQQPDHRSAPGRMARAGSARPLQRDPLLSSIPACRKQRIMGAASDKSIREQRLAAKLRENLRRRKTQGRQLSREPAPRLGELAGGALPNPPDGG